MPRASIVTALAVLACTACDGAPTRPAAAILVVDVDIAGDGLVRVHEGHVWQHGDGPTSRELTFPAYVPGAFPLRPVLTPLRATLDGEPVAVRVRRHDAWIHLDLAHTRTDAARHRLDLEYTLLGAWTPGEGATRVLRMQQIEPHAPISRRDVSLRISAPDAASLGLWVAHGHGAYERVALRRADAAWIAELGPSPPGEPLFWQLGVAGPGFDPAPPPYLRTLSQQSGSVPWALLLLLTAALVLCVLPPDRTITATRLLHVALAAVVAWELLIEQLLYWIPNAAVPGERWTDSLVEIAAAAGLVALIVDFLRAQDRGLRARLPEAHELEFAVPVVLALAVPMASIRTSLLLLPLLGLPLLIPWSRRRVALAMGAELHTIVEVVQTHGTITLSALAAELRLRPDTLATLLARHPELPLVVDHAGGRVLAASAAALRDDLRVCPGCGGATEIRGQDLLACPYCRREYASTDRPEPAAPVPLVVRAAARLLTVLARSLVAWALLIGLAFVLMALLADDLALLPALFGALIFWLPAHALRTLLDRLADALLAGRARAALVALLVLTSPLILPIFALSRVRGRRVRMHFDRSAVARLDAELQRVGELDLAALARWLETSWDEALLLAVHLCGAHRIDAVLDRPGRRVISRARLRTLAAAATCHACGGIVGVLGGVARCQFCGTPAPITAAAAPAPARA